MQKAADSLNIRDPEELLKHRLISTQPADIAAVLVSQAIVLTVSQLAD